VTSPGLGAAGGADDARSEIVAAAGHAPSVHNTQPWRFALYADGPTSGVDLYADEDRRLPVLDPLGRQLHLPCGAALLHAQVAAGARGLSAHAQLLPDADDPEHLAEDHGAYLRPLTHGDDLLHLEVLLDRADRQQGADPLYRRELAAWAHLVGPAADVIPAAALPVDAQRGSLLRLPDPDPDPDAGGARPGLAAGQPPVAERPDVAVGVSDDDTPLSWLRAGQALCAVLLQAAHEGVMAQPLAQATDLPGSRQRLGAALGLVGSPQLALRLGHPAGTVAATTPRRDVADLLRGTEGTGG
jgi:nitroreductase